VLKSQLGLRGLSVTGIQLDDVVLVNERSVECRSSKKSVGFRLLITNCLASLRDPLGAGTKGRRIMPPPFHQKSPLPLPSTVLRTCFAKEGLGSGKRKSPFEKGDKGGFEIEFSRYHHLDFLNELWIHDGSKSLQAERPGGVAGEREASHRRLKSVFFVVGITQA
jgi:hypothetical protein